MAVVRRARRRAPSRARSRRPSRSGARTPSARGTGSRCRCCAASARRRGSTSRCPGKAAETRRAAGGGERRLLARRRRRVGALGPAGGDRRRGSPWPYGWRRLVDVEGSASGVSARERVAVACRAHGSSLALRERVDGSVAGSSCTMSGRWSLPEPSSERSTTEPVAFQPNPTPSRGRSERRAGPAWSVDQVPTDAVAGLRSRHRGSGRACRRRRRAAPCGRRVALKSPAMITFGVGALIGEPLQVVAPVLHVALPRRDGVRGDDDRAVAVDRHRDGARDRAGVARAVGEDSMTAVVAEIGAR